MPTADVVIIGGGAVGGAIAYHLAKRQAGRVVLLEQHAVASGNTSLAAGLLTRARFQASHTPLVLETYRAIEEIEASTGESLGLRKVGCLYVARSPEAKQVVRRLGLSAGEAGLRMDRLSGAQALARLPWLATAPDEQFGFMADDGHIDGHRLASGYVHWARDHGVEVRAWSRVHSLQRQAERILGVELEQGRIDAPLVIDAAGVWSGMLAREIGVALPMAPIRSHYWLTEPHPLFAPAQPLVILPDARAYARTEADRLLFGYREARSLVVHPRRLPERMEDFLPERDPQGREGLVEAGAHLVEHCPSLSAIGIARYVVGLSTYTPDGNLVLGALPGLTGFLAATGCNGAGLAMSGGIGRMIAEMALGVAPAIDPAPHRIDRFGMVDALEPGFLERCGAARSGKLTG